MTKAPNWTSEEINYLMNVWEDKTIQTEIICDTLKRTRQTISSKARSLGLSRGHHTLFTKEEMDILIKNYPYMSNKDLQLKFFPNKTEDQIMNAGTNHKLKKDSEYLKEQQIKVGLNNLKLVPDMNGSNSPKWVERIELRCDYCDNIIVRTKAKTKDKNYCSKSCLYQDKILSSIGENNPNWSGGYSDIKKYGRLLLKQWKIDSMRSCEYKCIITGESFKDIHHIKPYDEIFYETLESLMLPQKKLISDYTDSEIILFRNKLIENHYKYPLGVCLTKELHEEFHKIYGKRSFTIENWEEFYKIKTS
jgi:hypothetical protein